MTHTFPLQCMQPLHIVLLRFFRHTVTICLQLLQGVSITDFTGFYVIQMLSNFKHCDMTTLVLLWNRVQQIQVQVMNTHLWVYCNALFKTLNKHNHIELLCKVNEKTFLFENPKNSQIFHLEMFNWEEEESRCWKCCNKTSPNIPHYVS